MSKINDNFIFFGCWNQGQCDINDPQLNGLSNVMSNLTINAQKNGSPKFYVIAGDNYYPQKNKDKTKDKIFNEEQLNSGFKCLETLYYISNKLSQIYILMGNHDLQYENNLVNTQDEKINDHCIILQSELKYKDLFNFNKRHVKFNNTLLLFTTSILFTDDFLPDLKKKDKKEKKKDKDETLKGGSPELDCIDIFQNETLKEIHLKSNKSKEITLSDIKWEYEDFNQLVKNEIDHLLKLATVYSNDKEIKNIAICGHDPIVSIKNKDGQKKGTMLNNIGINLFNEIYNKFSNANKFYLCADIHHFQQCQIILGDHLVEQFVVGTGGTACDDMCIDEKDLPFVYNFPDELEDEANFILENKAPDLIKKYTLINCIYKQGYLIGQQNSEGIFDPKFEPTYDCFSKPNFNLSDVKKEEKSKGGSKKRKKSKKHKKTKKKKHKKN